MKPIVHTIIHPISSELTAAPSQTLFVIWYIFLETKTVTGTKNIKPYEDVQLLIELPVACKTIVVIVANTQTPRELNTTVMTISSHFGIFLPLA